MRLRNDDRLRIRHIKEKSPLIVVYLLLGMTKFMPRELVRQRFQKNR